MTGALDCRIDASQPQNCPPAAANPTKIRLYHAIKGTSAVADDFKTEAEKGKKKHCCIAWGLSVWNTKTGVELARRAVPGFRKKCIVAFDVDVQDGVLLHTPTERQPEHHTFWREKSKTFHQASTIFLPRNSP